MKRWLITLGLALVVAGGLYYLSQQYRSFNQLTRTNENLQRQLATLQRQERQLLSEAKRVESWNRLWEEVLSSRLAPEHWFVNPIAITREGGFNELEEMIEFFSNNDPRQSGFWFKPESVNIRRLPAGSAPVEGGDQTVPMGDRFDFAIRGQFLIPKLAADR